MIGAHGVHAHLLSADTECGNLLTLDTPEKVLWYWVLYRAIKDFLMYKNGYYGSKNSYYIHSGKSQNQNLKELGEWFENTEVGQGTFQWIIDHIANDPQHFRHKITEYIHSDVDIFDETTGFLHKRATRCVA